MTIEDNLIARDSKHIWHPCAQMKDYELFKPLEIVRADNCIIETRDGRKIIDGIASWWCKSLGHQHPRLKAALSRQMDKFEHVMFAHTTHTAIVELSEKLATLTPSLNKVLYASDGSSAVEMAMKMSVHARHIQGDDKRAVFIALANGYHGETLGALSASDLGLYRQAYEPLLFKVHFLSPLPYVTHTQDALWQDCETVWLPLLQQLEALSEQITAVILEPIVQGAGGMKMYSQDLLRRLRQWTEKHGIHLIADEIMTGMGRTGKMLACHHANIEPDFLCLSKGLTSGYLPFSAMMTRQSIYDLFYDDYAKGKSFLHSHTQSGNALAASVALEVWRIIEEDNLCDKAAELGQIMYTSMMEIAEDTKKLTNVRSLGAIVAAEFVGYHPDRRIGFEFYHQAMQRGALLRPLGKTLYWLPPLTMDRQTLQRLKMITQETIVALD
jgi:adenosylmethionine---8-amino-7-oxononanoate aminotransferase